VGELVGSGGLGPSRAATEFDHWLDESKEGPASLSGGEGGAVKRTANGEVVVFGEEERALLRVSHSAELRFSCPEGA
jgi:hypothetical protein